MLERRLGIRTALFLTLSLVLILNLGSVAFACEFHGGYGQAPWGAHGTSTPPPENFGVPARSRVVTLPQPYYLAMPFQLNASLGRPVEVTLQYQMAQAARQKLALTVSADPSIDILGPVATEVTAPKGQHTLTVIPHKTGLFKIRISAEIATPAGMETVQTTSYLNVKQQAL